MKNKSVKYLLVFMIIALLAAGGYFGYQYYLTTNKAPLAEENSAQISSLREAISLNNIDAVEFLVKNKVDLETPFDTSEEKQDNGFTALGWAVFSNRPEIAMYLINHGADVKAEVPLGSSMLFWAITYNMEDVAEAIIENGGDIYPHNGYNPALHAAVQGRNKIVDMLAAKGILPDDHHENQENAEEEQKTLEK